MKILFAIKTIDTSKGGAEKVLADVSSGLADRGHTVSVLSFDPPNGKAFYNFSPKVKRIKLGVGNVLRKATFGEVITRMRVIRKVVKRQKPDVVIAFMHSSFIPCSFALIGTGVPLIASEHIVPKHYKKRKWEFLLLILSRFFVKKITVLSKDIIRTYPFAFLRRKMIPIANPVKIVLPDNKIVNNENKKEKIILNVGRLTEQKNQATLIRAFARLANDYPDWSVRIIGEGELHSELLRIIKKFNMQERIILAGTTPHISEEYQAANIFALPSTYESFGLATAEAMAHGLPAIGYINCPGTNELIVNNKSGILVDSVKPIDSFTAGLKRLMDDQELRAALGQKAIKRVEQYNPELIFDKWEKLARKTAKIK